MNEKAYLKKLAPLAQMNLWEGFIEMIRYETDAVQRTLEQSSSNVDIYRAQGAILLLRKLLKLKDEINAAKK